MSHLDINKFRTEYDEVSNRLSDIGKIDKRELGSVFARQAQLLEILGVATELEEINKKISEAEKIIEEGLDDDFVQMARQEILDLQPRKDELNAEINLLLIPPDPHDNKNVIIEIRAGTGGEEASLFANELFRMYTRFANVKGWNLQVLSLSGSETGGIKEVILKISGKSIYKVLKYESGVHRVQRVPATESAGRIHTSAASVVVMPEIDDIEITINPNDLVIDVYRSGGNGGQSVNTTDSAVRITHIPTGLVVTCQDTKEQQKNKASAMVVLRSRLYQIELDKQQSELSDIRKNSIKTGDRSDKIKTYNFPQDRLTDHRIKRSWFGLERVMGGEIEEILRETYVTIEKESSVILD